MLESTEDIPAVTSIKAIIRPFSLLPALLTTEIPIFCAKPVWNNAAPIINIPANKTTVLSDKPLNTCFIGITPNKPSAIAPPIEVIASGIISVTNNNAITPRTIKVCTAGSIRINSSLRDTFLISCKTL